MSLEQKASAALNALSVGTGSQQLCVLHEHRQLTCELTAVESLACAFISLELRTEKLANATIAQLQNLAEALSKRLNYLLEPITPIEVDAEQCVVQLRSNPPHTEESRRGYYELLVRRGGALSLKRYSKTPGEVRQPVPASVTREVLLRLIADFAAVAP